MIDKLSQRLRLQTWMFQLQFFIDINNANNYLEELPLKFDDNNRNAYNSAHNQTNTNPSQLLHTQHHFRHEINCHTLQRHTIQINHKSRMCVRKNSSIRKRAIATIQVYLVISFSEQHGIQLGEANRSCIWMMAITEHQARNKRL